jgi:hypothetical protein
MKKITYFLCTCFLIIAFLSCSKKETINNEKLVGVWFEEEYLEDSTEISRLEYNFMDCNIVEILRIELENNSRNVLGYRWRTLANYKLVGDQLSFYNMISYSNDDTKEPYAKFENLQLLSGSEGSSYSVTCNFGDNDKKIIFIYPPCGELANCIGSETFIKK